MNFKDKINAIDAASMTVEELYSEIGITEEKYVEDAMKKVRKQKFLATALPKVNAYLSKADSKSAITMPRMALNAMLLK